MIEDQNHSIRGDRALGAGDADRLGFRDLAKRIAISVVDHASENGLVVGLEGSWGSGKSSLLFLINDEVKKLPIDQQPTVINFRPWLIGNRDNLIFSLFGELSNQLDAVALQAGDATRVSVAKAQAAAKALKRFISGLSSAGSAIEIAGDASGFAPIRWVGKGLKALGEWSQHDKSPRSLADLKDDLAKSLRDLNHRFIVTIDDVDRIDAEEVIEILRLVRSVADLPNVIYILCYDLNVISHSIEHYKGIRDGRAYLEKIVQLNIMVPKPEPLQLRQWFTDELHTFASAKDEDELSRLQIVIDYEGGRLLKTPRSVVRALDAMRFFWPPLRDAKADLADAVWIQLIKDANSNLYRWLEEYCATASVISFGAARVEDTAKKQELDGLLRSVEDGYFDDIGYRSNFSEHLPGVEPDYADESVVKFQIFQQVPTAERDNAIKGKRLASPDHYRLYFSFSTPSYALTSEDYVSAWSAIACGPERAGAVILQLHNETVAGSLTKADLMLERIKGEAYRALTPDDCQHLLIALSQVMDEAYRQQRFDRFWVNSIWDRAEKLISPLLSRLESARRQDTVETMFGRGDAIGWLTSLLRQETFAQGRFGEKKRPNNEWLFTGPELERINSLMLTRYRQMTAEEIFSSPSPTSLLFAWQQAGDDTGPRNVVEAQITSDLGLVEALEGMLGTVNSSDRGRFSILRKDNVSSFMNYENAKIRIQNLIDDKDLGVRAKRLAIAFDDGANY